jgi:hypothetical protein
MHAIEFQTKIQNGRVEIPDRYKSLLDETESVRVICLIEENQLVSPPISQEDGLFEALASLAQELNLSENKLLALALEEYLRRYKAKKFLQSWNDAYEEDLDESEEAILAGMLRHQRELNEMKFNAIAS